MESFQQGCDRDVSSHDVDDSVPPVVLLPHGATHAVRAEVTLVITA